jgi:hypothetical protein
MKSFRGFGERNPSRPSFDKGRRKSLFLKEGFREIYRNGFRTILLIPPCEAVLLISQREKEFLHTGEFPSPIRRGLGRGFYNVHTFCIKNIEEIGNRHGTKSD